MAKSASSNSNSSPSFQAPRYEPRWVIASLCFLIGTLLIVAFIDFVPEQSTMVSTNPTAKNLVGKFGSEAAWWSLHLIGISTWLIPAFLLWMSYVAVRNARRLVLTRFVAMIMSIVAFSGLGAMVESFPKNQYFSEGLGGILGTLIYQEGLSETVGVFGSGLMLAMIYGIGLMFIITKDIAAEFEQAASGFHEWRERMAQNRAEKAEIKRKLKEAKERQKTAIPPVLVGPPPTKKLSIARTGGTNAPIGGTNTPFAPEKNGQPVAGSPAADARARLAEAKTAPLSEDPATRAARTAAAEGKGTVSPFAENAPLATDTKGLAVNAAGRIELNIVKPEEPKKAAKVTVPQSTDENYKFPPLTLLKEQAKPAQGNSEDEHRRNAENLLRILSEFGVDVSLGEIHVGPVITRYEVIPAPGVRVEKIAGLDKNIALGMRAQSVRILAPIPGKAAVGVEVPNQHATPVGMRELLESEDWVGAKAELPIALGKDVSGKPLVSDLTKMPHLLIAGATGSGKSVCINSIVASILYSKSPKDVRLLMVDPKIVELKIFNTLPHMLIPVVTEAKKVPSALKWLLGEMEQRYQIFAKVGVRNITGFNGRKKTAPKEGAEIKDSAEGAAEVQQNLNGVAPAPDDI
jgi:DNA segregation ATPase FtsK/SpoIIIE, S-DNA-T family